MLQNDRERTEYSAERLAQALLSFAGRLEKSECPVAQDAAQRLRCDVKSAKVMKAVVKMANNQP